MTMPLGNFTITILNAPLKQDGRSGNLKREWGEAVSTVLPGCWLLPISGDEAVQDREFSMVNLRLYTPWTEHLLVTSRVEVNNLTYEVNGEPRRWPGPAGDWHHIEADIKRLTG